jgi:hypothetical protein
MLSPKEAAINTGAELRRAVQQRPPGHVRACRYKADRKIREIVNDDQKRKLDQLDQEPPPVLHGNLNGATPPEAAGAQILKRSPSPIVPVGGERPASGKLGRSRLSPELAPPFSESRWTGQSSG